MSSPTMASAKLAIVNGPLIAIVNGPLIMACLTSEDDSHGLSDGGDASDSNRAGGSKWRAQRPAACGRAGCIGRRIQATKGNPFLCCSVPLLLCTGP